MHSDDPTKMGYAVFRNLLQFPGKVYPVNNKRPEIQGVKCYPTLSDIPGPVDMVAITVPAQLVPGIMSECGLKGVKMAVVITAGFKEMDEDGRALENRMVEIAKNYGIRIVGPNCLGLILPPYKLDTTYVSTSPLPRRHRVHFPVGSYRQRSCRNIPFRRLRDGILRGCFGR